MKQLGEIKQVIQDKSQHWGERGYTLLLYASIAFAPLKKSYKPNMIREMPNDEKVLLLVAQNVGCN